MTRAVLVALVSVFGVAAADEVRAPPDAVERALVDAYYAFEVAGYCGLVDDRVGHGFRAEVRRIKGEREWPRERLDWLRGKAWQAAHAEWQNRGLGGFRGWCREEGRAAARRFSGSP